MSCCGSQRAQFSRMDQSHPPAEDRLQTPRFEYMGTTGMTVVGPVTGRRYRFQGHGSRIPIDPRDAAAMVAVPHLRRV